MRKQHTQTPVRWHEKTTPHPLRLILRTLGEEYPVVEGGEGGVTVSFEHGGASGSYTVSRIGNAAAVRYHTPAQAIRCVGALMGGVVRDGIPLVERDRFGTLGIMLDCSRNAVMTVDHFKKWLRRLSLMGYNMAMLYTEETYQLDKEPYFGHMRGAYSKTELREVDAYAAALGIGMIPCIQTLGHLAHILKWGAYGDVKDTTEVLMVGEEKTYALIEKMVSHWKSVFRSKRIHIGMDEAWDLGRGVYLSKKGYVPEFDLFNRHLARVKTICESHGLKPMIWSDMYFTMGSPNRGYYDKECRIPDAVRRRIPKTVQLVYWDYYHEDPAFYRDYIKKHRALGFEPVVASGVWTWSKFWCDHVKTEAAAGACIDACIKENIRELLFTMWGDNGAYCDFDSALAGLAWTAEKAFSAKGVDTETLGKRFGAVCGGDYAAHERAGDISHAPINAAQYMWDDPLMQRTLTDAIMKNRTAPEKGIAHFRGVAHDLAPHTQDCESGDINHALLLARLLGDRIDLDMRLRRGYRRKDRRALRRVAVDAVMMRGRISEVAYSFRAMWMRHNKPFGLEIIQSRFAALSARYGEVAVRVGELLGGKIPCIEELDECGKRLGT